MSDTSTYAFRVADLSQHSPTRFDLRPDSATCSALAEELGVLALRKLRFAGEIAAQGRRDWVLSASLGATVVQPCVVTLEPVTSRIDFDVRRLYVAHMPEIEEDEIEMPEDDSVEALGKIIDPGAVMAESLALALPQYPRKEGADLGAAVFAAPGVEPMTDEDARPFAGLAQLRESLKKDS